MSKGDEEAPASNNEPSELEPSSEKKVSGVPLQRIIKQVIAQASFHSGPLPDPKTLEKYDALVPKGAERIFRMAEEQQKHRHKLETTVTEGNLRLASNGQKYAFYLSLLILAVASVFA